MLLADRDVGIRRLNVHVDVEDFGNRFPHLQEPLLADVVNGILVTVDDVADSVSTIENVLILLSVAGALKLWRCRDPLRFVGRAVGATVDMSETCVA